MKHISIFLVWIIGLVGIFAFMISTLKVKEYFPLPLVIIYGWSYLVYTAIMPKKKITTTPDQEIRILEMLYRIKNNIPPPPQY